MTGFLLVMYLCGSQGEYSLPTRPQISISSDYIEDL